MMMMMKKKKKKPPSNRREGSTMTKTNFLLPLHTEDYKYKIN